MEQRRAAVRLALVTLVAGALVPLAGATPAAAVPGCLDETAPSLLQNGCDDSMPPGTTLTSSASPHPTAGRHTSAARTIDGAGNASAWSEPVGHPQQPPLTRSCDDRRSRGPPSAREGS